MRLSILIIFVATVVVVVIGFSTGAAYNFRAPIERASGGASSVQYSHVRQAISLLETRTFNFGEHGYTGQLRGPLYPSLLAIAFTVGGRYVGSIFVLNFVLLVLALVILFAASRRLLSGAWALFPPLLLALYWGAASQVWIANYETLTLFLASLSIFAFVRGMQEKQVRWFFILGASFALWALEKPAILYFIPVALGYFYFALPRERKLKAILLCAAPIVVFVGAWSLRNSIAIDTWQIGSAGHTILRRASQTQMPKERLVSITLAYTVGNYLGSMIYPPFFPHDDMFRTWDTAIDARWYQQSWLVREPTGEVVTKTELDHLMYKEARLIILEHPFKFILTAIPQFFRLNSPLNHKGQEIAPMFMDSSFDWGKIIFALGIRLGWFTFLALVLWGMARSYKNPVWFFFTLLILYYNFSNALLTHAEGRYLLVILPLYALMAAYGLGYRRGDVRTVV